MDAKQQYKEVYSRLRKANSVSLTFDEMRTYKVIALNAAKTMFAKKHAHDQLEYLQSRLSNKRKQIAIRKQNEVIMARGIKF